MQYVTRKPTYIIHEIFYNSVLDQLLNYTLYEIYLNVRARVYDQVLQRRALSSRERKKFHYLFNDFHLANFQSYRIINRCY